VSIVPEGNVMYGMQLPIQTLTRTLREDWEDSATVDDLIAVAKACDDAGFGFVGVCDHIGLPLNDYTKHMTPTWYDPVSTLAFLAAHTSRTRLLTDIYVAPYRHPLQSAKSFMTLDHLSGGRVILGIGVGHVEAEFDALGIDFSSRGARTDEAIDAMRAAFDAEYSQYSGSFYDYKEVGLAPRPDQQHLPIWIGGSGKAALRRAAERGDGWIPMGAPRDRMRELTDYARSYVDKVRPGASLDLGFMPEWIYVGEPTWDVGPNRLTGSPQKIAESLRFAREVGCSVVHLRFRSRTRDELCDQIAAFGRDVAPSI
jgi:probable F420-dependent oxidoreductase